MERLPWLNRVGCGSTSSLPRETPSVKRIIVTGATGFVGANFARRLLHDGHEIHLWSAPSMPHGARMRFVLEVQIHSVDFADQGGTCSCGPQGPS